MNLAYREGDDSISAKTASKSVQRCKCAVDSYLTTCSSRYRGKATTLSRQQQFGAQHGSEKSAETAQSYDEMIELKVGSRDMDRRTDRDSFPQQYTRNRIGEQ